MFFKNNFFISNHKNDMYKPSVVASFVVDTQGVVGLAVDKQLVDEQVVYSWPEHNCGM